MAAAHEEKTCAEKAEEEACKASELKECVQPGEFPMLFFSPNHVADPDSVQKSAIEYLLCRDVPESLQGNNDEMAKTCTGDGPCACCTYECTGCNDEHECPNRTCGYGYEVLARAAEKVASMEHIPVQLYGKCFSDYPAGTVLVFDPNVAPQNPTENPCEARKAGAFIPKTIESVVCEVLKEKGLI